MARGDWIIWEHSPEHRFRCLSCQGTLNVNRVLPQPVEISVGISKAFERYHKRCPSPFPARRKLLRLLAKRMARRTP